MPDGAESYYTNSVERPSNRYEDYVATDLVNDVEARFPAIGAREFRAVIGVSMGGFGAIKLALDHPQLFASPAPLVPPLTFRVDGLRSEGRRSGGTIGRSLGPGAARPGGRMIPSSRQRPLTLHRSHTST